MALGHWTHMTFLTISWLAIDFRRMRGTTVLRFLVIGFPAGIPKIPLNLTLLKSCDIRGVFWGAAVARDPKANQQNLAEMFALYQEGKIKPHVSASFPLEKGGDAIRYLMDRKALGKVVVTV